MLRCLSLSVKGAEGCMAASSRLWPTKSLRNNQREKEIALAPLAGIHRFPRPSFLYGPPDDIIQLLIESPDPTCWDPQVPKPLLLGQRLELLLRGGSGSSGGRRLGCPSARPVTEAGSTTASRSEAGQGAGPQPRQACQPLELPRVLHTCSGWTVQRCAVCACATSTGSAIARGAAREREILSP